MAKRLWVQSFAVIGALTGVSLFAQTPRKTAAEWQAKMTLAKETDDRVAVLRDALEIAETFGESDLRLFQTVLRLAQECEADCGDKHPDYLGRALKMRAHVRPAGLDLADALMDLAAAASQSDHYRDALMVYGEAIEIRERLLGKTHHKVAEGYAALARVYQLQGDSAQARRTMGYALEIREHAGAAMSPGYAELLLNSAFLYDWAKQGAKAAEEYERAIALYERLWRPPDARLTAGLRRVANQLSSVNRASRAEALLRRILDIQKRWRANRREYYEALRGLADFLRAHRRFLEAEAAYLEAVTVRRRMGKEDAPAAWCMRQVAECRFERGAFHETVAAADLSRAMYGRIADAPEFQVLPLYQLLIKTHLRLHNDDKAEEYFKLLESSVAANSRWYLIKAAEEASAIYQERRNYTRAAEKLELEIATREVVNPRDNELPLKIIQLAKLYQTMGRVDDANRVSIAAMKLMLSDVMSDAAEDQSKRLLLAGIVLVLVVVPMVLSAVSAVVYWQLTKRLDRKLEMLFAPAVPRAAPMETPAALSLEEAEDPQLAPLEAPAAITAAADSLVAVAASASVAAAAPGVEVAGDQQLGPSDAVPATAAAPAEVPAAPVARVAVTAEASVLFAIRVLNLLLSILTLGVYSFWGKAKVRRFVCSQSEFLGDRFAFHGTGRELLLGWLGALPALAFIVLFPQVLPVVWRSNASIWAAPLCSMGVFLLLWPIARVGAYRYRLNRMSWRGIRFSYRGATLQFLGASLAGGLATLATLGIYAPFLQVRLRRLLFGHTYFGNGEFQFSGRGKDLLPAWFFAAPMCLGTLGFGWAWWSALRHRYYWAHTTFAGARFRCTATGWKLLRLWIGNTVIIVCTLGLGMSWVMLRTLHFWTRHIELAGDPQLATIRQDARAAAASGESFADFLGFDFGF